jgi:hypothetical protein
MEQGCKVCSLLPHRCSWGSVRWRCTWTANSRQIPPTIQRYIPINVNEATRVLPKTKSWVSARLESFFRSTSELLLDVVDEDGGTTCSARNGTDGRDALVAGWPKSNGEGTRVVGMPSSDGHEACAGVLVQGFPKRPLRRKRRLIKEFHTFLYER